MEEQDKIFDSSIPYPVPTLNDAVEDYLADKLLDKKLQLCKHPALGLFTLAEKQALRKELIDLAKECYKWAITK